MMTRRGLIRIGAASVGSMALRPFGLLPAMAQSGPDYRALVCIFLFGGNDSNNTIGPMDTARFDQYTNLRKGLALSSSVLKQVQVADGQVYGFHPNMAVVQAWFRPRSLR